MKYYYHQHLRGYEKVKAEGKTAWHEIHGRNGFENFYSREFLQAVLPRLHFGRKQTSVLELGCGTGPVACYLARRGFCVDAIDLIPAAIEIAGEQANKRNLDIHFQVVDVVELPHHGKVYDVIVDSYCLQGVVTDSDRQRLFAAIRARLKPQGYYLVSTAYFDEQRYCEDKIIRDEAGGKVYHHYGDDQIMDATTNIVYRELATNHEEWEDAVLIADRWYLPYRRHHKPDVIREELTQAGFGILHQDVGNFVCCHKEARVSRS